jgi:hypothetical protein
MTNNTVTVTLEGEITLQALADTLRKLEALLGALVADSAAVSSIDWMVTDLRLGDSATITLTGQPGEEDAAGRAVAGLVAALRALRAQRPIPYSPRVVRRVHDLEAVVTGPISSLQVETEEDAVVLHRQGSPGEVAGVGAYGAVDGRIETLTSRRDLRFTLFDTLFDRGVVCALTEDRRDLLRDAWGRWAIVEGWVSCDPFSGRPVAIQHITAIEIVDDQLVSAQQQAHRRLDQVGSDARLTALRGSQRNAF